MLDEVARERLSAVGIMTVEEFVSAVGASLVSMAMVLDQPEEQVAELADRAAAELSMEQREMLDQPAQKYPLGALPPRRKSERPPEPPSDLEDDSYSADSDEDSDVESNAAGDAE